MSTNTNIQAAQARYNAALANYNTQYNNYTNSSSFAPSRALNQAQAELDAASAQLDAARKANTMTTAALTGYGTEAASTGIDAAFGTDASYSQSLITVQSAGRAGAAGLIGFNALDDLSNALDGAQSSMNSSSNLYSATPMYPQNNNNFYSSGSSIYPQNNNNSYSAGSSTNRSRGSAQNSAAQNYADNLFSSVTNYSNSLSNPSSYADNLMSGNTGSSSRMTTNSDRGGSSSSSSGYTPGTQVWSATRCWGRDGQEYRSGKVLEAPKQNSLGKTFVYVRWDNGDIRGEPIESLSLSRGGGSQQNNSSGNKKGYSGTAGVAK